MRYALALAAALFVSPAMAAGDISDLQVLPGRVNAGSPFTSGNFTIRNTSSSSFASAKVVCTLLQNSEPVDQDYSYIENIGAGQIVYGRVSFLRTKEIGTISCRVTSLE